jgi:formylglycine-generating enzyme
MADKEIGEENMKGIKKINIQRTKEILFAIVFLSQTITFFSCSNLYDNYEKKSNSTNAAAADSSFATYTNTLTMVAVNGGSFNNGTADMAVSSFYIGKYEVTQKQYKEVMGSIPGSCSGTYGLGDNYPVYYVTWYNAVAFCNALSEKEGYSNVYTISGTSVTADFTKNGYRLPTEAEWQFAAMGGNSSRGYTYSGSNTIGDVAWYEDNADSTTHTVGLKAANELGLYDMSGNVYEWCWDWYGDYPAAAQTDYTGPSSGTYPSERGGCWSCTGTYCLVYYRGGNGFPRTWKNDDLGFRVVRDGSGTSVTGITLNKTAVSIIKENTIQLTATVSPSNAANTEIAWASSNSAVATVSTSGLVTGVASGSATITVTTDDGGYTAKCTVTVNAEYKNSIDIIMEPVTGGTFDMGSSNGDTDEKPVHLVTLSSFYIGKYEVTQDQYKEIMGTNPSQFSGSNLPVECVTWYKAIAFCNALSEKEGYDDVYTINGTSVTGDFTKNGYRLPTEAEWEFSARGGNNSKEYTYSGSNTINDVAWYSDNSDSTTHTIGKKTANELGLCDMTGNGYEWCWDWYNSSYSSTSQTNPRGDSSGTYRVVRGGGWHATAYSCRNTARLGVKPSTASGDNSFRLVRNITSSSVSVTDITLSKTTASIIKGNTIQLTATVSPSDATDTGVTWTSSNSAVAAVSTSGLVTGVASGSATITVTTDDGGYTAKCIVTVTDSDTLVMPAVSASYNSTFAKTTISFSTSSLSDVQYLYLYENTTDNFTTATLLCEYNKSETSWSSKTQKEIAPAFTVTGYTSDGTYYYWITGKKENGSESAESNTASVRVSSDLSTYQYVPENAECRSVGDSWKYTITSTGADTSQFFYVTEGTTIKIYGSGTATASVGLKIYLAASTPSSYISGSSDTYNYDWQTTEQSVTITKTGYYVIERYNKSTGIYYLAIKE